MPPRPGLNSNGIGGLLLVPNPLLGLPNPIPLGSTSREPEPLPEPTADGD